MAGGYNKYRKTSNYPYRKGNSGWKSTVSKRSSGNIKAAFEQRDQCEVVLNCNVQAGCYFDKTYSNNQCQVAAVNVFDALNKSQFYNNYAPMYDQVRIDKVKAKITSLQYPKMKNEEYYSNISVVTAFDRNGLDPVQIATGLLGKQGDTSYPASVSTKIGKDVATYSSALTKNLSYGSTFEVVRYISPFLEL